MATAKKTQIVITANAAVAKKVMDELQQRVDAIKQKMAALDVTTKQGQREFKKLEKELVSYNSAASQNVTNTERISKAMKNLSGTSLNELKRALSAAKSELGKMSANDKGLKQMQGNVKALQGQIDKLTGAVHKQGGAWQTALKNLTAYVGLFQVFNTVKSLFVDLFRLNMQFSEQLTDIRKVALSTTDEIANLSRELAKIDTRTSLEELNKIAYAGAKLGIQTQGGTAALAGFVRAADQVNVALKEDLGDEALTALAKITEVMGLIKKYGVEQAMLKTGSAIFRLASTSTATSNKIVDFSNRMLALGEQAALTTPDILALGAAVDSMALEPEVAATAFGKLVTELRKGTSSIEETLGIASGSLKKMIESGKGMDAILTLFRRMGETENVFALDGLFKEMGSDGTRLVKTMITMAAKNGMLTKAVEESNKAFAEGTAVSVEYNMQQETASAYMERASNLWEKQFVSASAASGPIRDIAKAWFEVTKELTSSVSFMTEARIAITLIFTSVKMLLNILPTLIIVLSTAGLAGAFMKLLTSLKSVEVASLTLNGVWIKMVTTFKKLSIVTQAGIMGGLIGLLGIGVVKLAQWTASLNQVAAGQRVLNEVQEEGMRKAMEEQEQLKRLHNVMNDTSASMDLRLEAMNKLNGAIPNLNAKINTETGAVKENTKAWEDNFKRLQEYYELEGARSKMADLGRQKVDAILDLQKKEDAYANTNVDILTGARPVTSGGPVLPAQVQGAIGQAGQRAEAKRARDKAQRTLDDIVAQEEALRKRFGAKLDVGTGKDNGKPQVVTDTNTGKATTPEDDARNNISEFITKIKNFYERQITATIEELTRQNVPKTLQKHAENDIRSRMNAVLAAAKTSLVLGTKEWDNIKNSIDKDRKEKDDEFGQSQSRLLENQILEYDMGKLRGDLLKQMPKIKKGKIVGYKSDERDRAYLDSRWLEASKSEQKVASVDREMMERRRKELLEHDYTGVVKENSFEGLINSGMADVTLDNFERDKDDVIKVLEDARKRIADVYSTDGDKDKLLKLLFGENYEKMPQAFMFLLDETDENVKYFYYKLIQYSDEYTAAQKKQDDEIKKVNDFNWKQTDYYKKYQDVMPGMEQKASVTGSYRNAGERMGFSNIANNDPELEMLKARMEFAKQYYDFIVAHNATEQQQAEARKSIMEAQANYAKKLTSDMFEQYNSLLGFMQPLQTFGAAVGDAFATMKDDAAAGRKALKKAVLDMAKSFATNSLQLISQQQIDRAQTTEHYTQLLLIQQAFGLAQVQGEAVIGKAMIAAKQTTNLTEEQLEAVHQKVMSALRSVGIFGWCVSALGPIAGPIAYSGMMAILMGLLSAAIGIIGGSDTANTSNSTTKSTKLVSGMLTYDSGNVQDLKPFVADNGDIYWAREDDGKRRSGVTMLNTPTATTINGRPSLVAENGPEIVIGRETTKAMMMNNPALLKALVNYDRNYSGRSAQRRAYDNGNVGETLENIPSGVSATEGLIADSRAANLALLGAVNALLQRLNEPISAKIDMYGRGNLYDSMTKANQFMKGKA